MDKNRLRILFKRISENNFSQEDIDEVNNWYHNLNLGDRQLKQWFKEAGGEEMLADQLYSSFEESINKQKKNRTILRVLQIAAAVIVISGIGLIFYFNQIRPQHQFAANISTKIVPEQKNAILTLSDGTIVDVKSLALGENKFSGATLEKTADGRLIYKVDQTVKNVGLKYNTINTPRGSQSEIILPDGTHVWLNAASTLKFPIRFDGDERKVVLDGEAYFEVAHNKKMPFRLQSGIQTITVLGTHFNVKAYKDEQMISTTLFQGRVSVENNKTAESKILVPGKQSDVTASGAGIIISNADLDQALSWKNGYFIFDNQDIKSIMTLISRCYDVDVEYHINTQERFGGTFQRSSDLSELLKNLESLGKTKFQLIERKVIVSN